MSKIQRRLIASLFVASTAFGGGMATAHADSLPPEHDFAIIASRIAAHEPLRIVAFGSSSTEGVGATAPTRTYPADLQADLSAALPGIDVSVINRGKGGQDAEDFHARLAAIIAEKPDLVIFQTGTNDPLRALPLAEFDQLTRADLVSIRSAGIDVLLMEPQFCRVFADKPGAFGYVAAIRQIGADLGIPVIRRWDLMKEWLASRIARPEELQAPDGLHMADRGYALLAAVVTKTILDQGHVLGHAPSMMASGD